MRKITIIILQSVGVLVATRLISIFTAYRGSEPLAPALLCLSLALSPVAFIILRRWWHDERGESPVPRLLQLGLCLLFALCGLVWAAGLLIRLAPHVSEGRMILLTWSTIPATLVLEYLWLRWIEEALESRQADRFPPRLLALPLLTVGLLAISWWSLRPLEFDSDRWREAGSWREDPTHWRMADDLVLNHLEVGMPAEEVSKLLGRNLSGRMQSSPIGHRAGWPTFGAGLQDAPPLTMNPAGGYGLPDLFCPDLSIFFDREHRLTFNLGW